MSDIRPPDIEPDEVTAIDVHVHVQASVRGGEVNGQFFRQMGDYFRCTS